jgi:GTP-binding protein EngB required for normal cell division
MSGSKQLAKKDIMILVLGATGAGKSFFINTVLGEEKMEVGSDLAPCTTEIGTGYLETIEGYPFLKDYRIVLVDTPGFNDRFVEDFEILEKIVTWLRKSYKEGSKLGGVIYLHDITTPRFDNAARRSLQIIQRLCGDGRLDNVVLATTKWGLRTPTSEDLQTELIIDYWKPLIEKGARVRRFDISHESAWSVISILFTAIEQGKLNRTLDPKAATGAGPYKFSITKAFRPFLGLFRRRSHAAL